MHRIVRYQTEIGLPCCRQCRAPLILMGSCCTWSPVVNKAIWGKEATVLNTEAPLKLLAHTITLIKVAVTWLTWENERSQPYSQCQKLICFSLMDGYGIKCKVRNYGWVSLTWGNFHTSSIYQLSWKGGMRSYGQSLKFY